MNKIAKQSIIKLAIIIGIMILSAFLTSAYAYLTPDHGDVSTHSDPEGSMPRFYTYKDYESVPFMCTNTGSDDGSSQLLSESQYSNGTAGASFEPSPGTTNASRGRVDAGQIHVNLEGQDVQNADKVYWGPPTDEGFVGSTEIKVAYLVATGGVYNATSTSHGDLYTNVVTFTHTPPWQKAGGLGASELVIPIVNQQDYLDIEITMTYNGGIEREMTQREIGMAYVWDALIEKSNDDPVHTTVLGDAETATYHGHKKQTVDEMVFEYIYSEISESHDNEPESPVQVANWIALGQRSDGEGPGRAIYEEAVEYAKFLKETNGQMDYKFVDVVENNKVVPVEVSNNDDGTVLVGPFCVEYTEWGVDGGRGWAQFAGIYDASVSTNDKPDGLNDDEYEFVYNPVKDKDGNVIKRKTNNLVNPQYPHSGDVFFIKIKKANNRTEFRSIDFKYRYLNVSGSAVEIKEKLYYYKWVIGIRDGNYAIVGTPYANSDNGSSTNEQQTQVIQIGGSRSYATYEDHYGLYSVNLSLTKKVVDHDNKEEINGHKFDLGKTYKFRVTIHETQNDARSGDNAKYSYDINLKAGETESITRYFKEKNAVPYYRIVEVDTGEAAEVKFTVDDGQRKTDFQNGIYGRFSDTKTISVIAYNKYEPKSAELELTKTLGKPAEEDEIYKFDVDITKNANNVLKDYSSAIHNGIELRVAKGQNVAHIVVDGKDLGTTAEFKYYWLGDAPSYKISEQMSEKYEVSFNDVKDDDGIIEGTFENKFNGTVNVDALNERAETKIRIKKVSEPELEEGDVKSYYFRIKVGTKYNIHETLTIPAPDTGSRKEVYGKVHDIILDNKNGDHYQIIEYNDENSMLRDSENGNVVDEGTLTVENGTDEAKYTKTAINEQSNHYIDLNIKKTFTEGNVPEEDIKFSFKVEAKQGDKPIKDFGLEASKENNWTSDTERVEWEYGSSLPVLKITEAKDSPYVINAVKVLDKDGNPVQNCKVTISQLDNSVTIENYPKDVQLTFEIENRSEEHHAKININKIVKIDDKEITPEDDNEYAFEFIINVTYADGTVESETVIASNKNVPSKTITWIGNNAPRVEIYEIKKEGFSLTDLIINGEKQNNPSSDSNKILIYDKQLTEGDVEILVDATNESDNVGTVDIYKLLVDADGNPVENSNSIFKFNLKQIGADGTTIIDSRDNVEIPVGGHYPYTATWKAGEDAPTFEISEIKIDGYEVKEIELNGTKIDGDTVKGSFSNEHTIEVKYTNQKVDDRHGKLVIGKRIVSTTDAAIPKDFTKTYQFKVLVQQVEEGKESKTLYDQVVSIQVNGNEPVQTKTLEFDWKSNEPTPKYSVEEVKENDTNLIAIYKDGEIVNEVEGILQKESTVKYEFENGIDVNSGKLTLKKQLQDDGKDSTNLNQEFYFDITIDNKKLPVVVLHPNETWESDVYTWVGDDDGPVFTITEENPTNSSFKEFSASGNVVNVERNGSTIKGRIKNEEDVNIVEIICTNKTNKNKANVKITKHGIASTIKNVSEEYMAEHYNGTGFIVDVSVIYDKGKYLVGGKEYSAENYYKTRLQFKVGQTINLPTIEWYGDGEGPTVIANEIEMPDGWRLLNYSGNNVVLKPNSENEIVIENEWGNKSFTIPLGGTVWVDDVKDEKNTPASAVNGIMDKDEVGVSNVGVIIKRYLIDNSDRIIKDTGYAKAYDIDGNEISIFPIYTDATGRWDVRRIEFPNLTEAEKAQGAVTVKYGVEYIYDGYTYEPTVYLSNSTDNSHITDPIATLNKTALSRAQSFYTSSGNTRNSMINRSFALDKETSRNEFNDRFALITGDSAIATDNSTSGYAVGTNNTITELKYEGTQVAYQPVGSKQTYTSLVSQLVTTDKEGRTLEAYQVKAYTLFNATNPVSRTVSSTGLAYPFDNKFIVGLESRSIAGDIYVATDKYLRNINLGLAYRPNADIEVTKDVDSAKVIVNQRLTELKVTSVARLTNNYLVKVESQDESQEISYQLGLYRSDYYYRAQAYATDKEVYYGLKKFYKQIQLGEDFEALMNLQAYITYKITVRNSSPTMAYDIAVGSIMDYADGSLELVTTNRENYIKDGTNGIGSKIVVAEAPYYVIGKDANKHAIKLGANATYTDNENGLTYNRTQMSFDNPVKLSSGSYATIYATYRIKTYSEDIEGSAITNGANGIKEKLDVINADGIELGNKANIAEVKSYSVYKTNGKLAGKVDKDSAPNNIDIVSKNAKEYYEDDTYGAPVITVEINGDASKTISGTVWEDNEITSKSTTDGVSLGDGKYTNGEFTVEGMNIELVEKIQIPTRPDSNEYLEYDYTWPENYDVTKNIISTEYDAKGNPLKSSLKALTGFDSTISSEGDGTYTFQNIPTGAYVVRFHYGDNNGDYDNDLVKLANGTVVKESDIFKFPAGGDNMKSNNPSSPTNTSNYDNDQLPAVYNGQDFKSAAYSLKLTDEWLSNGSGDTEIVSKAADSQARRLEVINNSRVLVNANTTLLATAEDKSANHTELYEQYSMFADTPKIRVDANIEEPDFENVNFGVVERPESRLVLDKEIEEITLLDNTNKELIKVKYKIDYTNDGVITQNPDGSYRLVNPAAALSIIEEESFGLEYLQSLSKMESKYGFLDNGTTLNTGAQNFRYIVYDTSMATSLTLKTTYRMTALNLGQADRTSAVLQQMSSDDIYAAAQILKVNKFVGDVRTYNGISYSTYQVAENKFKNKDTEIATLNNRFSDIVGKTYYSSSVENEPVVNSRVGQLIDYVDTGLTFEQSINISQDGSWYTTTDDYLYHNDVLDKSIFTTVDYNVLQGDAATSETKSKIIDKDGRYFDTTSKHNIILSVRNKTKSENENVNNSNPDLLKNLVPYSQNTTDSIGIIRLYTTRSIDSEAQDLIFDNISEIVNYENEVGRKTSKAVAGNADPKGQENLGPFAGALTEIDSSATEIITFSQPYGISDRTRFLAEITIGVFSALAIVAVGIVIVKKKVL